MKHTTEFLLERLEDTDNMLLRSAESIAERFERLGADLRRELVHAIESGSTEQMLAQIGSLPHMIGNAMAGCDSSPFARNLAMRALLEQQLALAEAAETSQAQDADRAARAAGQDD